MKMMTNLKKSFLLLTFVKVFLFASSDESLIPVDQEGSETAIGPGGSSISPAARSAVRSAAYQRGVDQGVLDNSSSGGGYGSPYNSTSAPSNYNAFPSGKVQDDITKQNQMRNQGTK